MRPFHELGHIALGTALRQLAAQVSNDAEKTYERFGFDIEPKWFPVFYVLANSGADSVVNIAKTINHSHVSVSKILKEMKQADLVESYKSTSDSRVTLVSLSSKARVMIPAMYAQCDAIDTAMTQLTKDTGVDLWQSLRVVERHLKFHPISTRVNEVQEDIRIVDYAPIYQAAFKALNVAWISKHFVMEAPDYKALDDPDGYILNNSGVIMIALYQGEPVGCCALIRVSDDTYELAKMAVSPSAQGKGIGLSLGRKIIERARLMKIKRLYLESNSKLLPALALYEKLGFKFIEGESSPYERCDVQMELNVASI
ncbi:bifunctional helix-turn-helix transcriptional regulator/GNAT family N-acetyltransferase [Alteromonas sp. KUL49]|uniref:bifunctional helix-turn-helix transcriptional regulator/GNAT family N-acetyltransferase n=1 Tax=Alteromonas sp. KUL49 TaxID=2480798 RepID=UPI00102F18A9|nr:bifunctional helix-turn-helix transcriptional regulator/GNAT family N-acetyltransferase [Alteromonas sp. KUL49]TAP41628.1 GNAT family N-acetyltransferase [Alteromonas sp. KUL49]GEA10731.1 MarR family transcriptional regulator [Alteromonas sp. KUL49]